MSALKWLPIETAPRDGTLVLLFVPYASNHTNEACTTLGKWRNHGISGCFRFRGDDGPDDMQPTYWAPLPSKYPDRVQSSRRSRRPS